MSRVGWWSGKLGAVLVVSGVLACAGGTGPQGPVGPSGAAGAAGSPGAAGADGQLRIYGDGSAGDLTVSGNKRLFTDVATDGNLQFKNVTIAAGATLTVPSGTVFHCSGTFDNAGSLVVDPQTGAEPGGFDITYVSGNLTASFRPSEPGLGSPVSSGEVSTGNAQASIGGRGIFADRTKVLPLSNVLGGGAGRGSPLYGGLGWGGGAVTVLAQGALSNEGNIIAVGGDGQNFGAGGGGGGVITLASETSILHSATGHLMAHGGAGGASGSYTPVGVLPGESIATSGGGGGGIIRLLAPQVSNAGTMDVSAGAPGTAGSSGTMNQSLHFGGGGGGGCGGSGGTGGRVLGADPEAAQVASVGVTFVALVNPTALY